jgi:hypothetical protein
MDFQVEVFESRPNIDDNYNYVDDPTVNNKKTLLTLTTKFLPYLGERFNALYIQESQNNPSPVIKLTTGYGVEYVDNFVAILRFIGEILTKLSPEDYKMISEYASGYHNALNMPDLIRDIHILGLKFSQALGFNPVSNSEDTQNKKNKKNKHAGKVYHKIHINKSTDFFYLAYYLENNIAMMCASLWICRLNKNCNPLQFEDIINISEMESQTSKFLVKRAIWFKTHNSDEKEHDFEVEPSLSELQQITVQLPDLFDVNKEIDKISAMPIAEIESLYIKTTPNKLNIASV